MQCYVDLYITKSRELELIITITQHLHSQQIKQHKNRSNNSKNEHTILIEDKDCLERAGWKLDTLVYKTHSDFLDG